MNNFTIALLVEYSPFVRVSHGFEHGTANIQNYLKGINSPSSNHSNENSKILSLNLTLNTHYSSKHFQLTLSKCPIIYYFE